MRIISKILPMLALLALMAGCQDHDMGDQMLVQEGLTLSGGQEAPPNNSPGSGSAVIKYNRTTKMLEYTVTFNNLTGPPAAGHIHASAPRGANSGVLIPFSGLPQATSGVIVGSAKIADDKEEDLLNGLFYINLHTAAYPAGEIRGQIEFYSLARNVVKKGLPLSPQQEVPPLNTPAKGSADVLYNKNTKLLSYYITWENLADIPNGAHIHGTADRGANAPVQHPFTDLIPKVRSGSFSNSVTVDGVKIKEAELLNGKYYFNLHDSVYPSGEIRGQIEF